MKALLRNVRIAPKKAAIVAKMVRGMPVLEAITLCQKTHKKAARLIEELLASAAANARNNDRQDPSLLVIRTIVVNQGAAMRRGTPMARGRMRPMNKFLSHIEVTLGYPMDEEGGSQAPKTASKGEKKTSQSDEKKVQASRSTAKSASPKKARPSSASRSSAASSK